MKANYKYVLIEPRILETEWGGSIIIPETRASRRDNAAFYGVVIDIGPKVKLDVAIGQKIIYIRNEGVKIDSIVALHEKHILGVLK